MLLFTAPLGGLEFGVLPLERVRTSLGPSIDSLTTGVRPSEQTLVAPLGGRDENTSPREFTRMS